MTEKIRILFVTENMTTRCGANVNILLTLVNKMKDNVVMDVLCKENSQKPHDILKEKLFNTCHYFEFSEGEILTKFQNQYDWRKKSVVKKCILLMSHPCVLRDMIDAKYFGSQRTKRKYIKEIEKTCANEQYNIVIGLCAPYYIAQAVAEAQISSIKAIIQLDPFTYNYTMPVSLLLFRKKLEKSVIRKLNHIFAASFVYDELIEKGIGDVNKMTSFMLPGILVDEICSPVVKNEKKDNNIINFAFIGQFYDKIRNPQFLLKLFCELPSNYVLHIYGGGAEAMIDRYRDELGDRLIHHGWVSSEVSKQQMNIVDFLVNVNNTIRNQMPSKLFEYIGTGKPIINICKSERCLSRKYISSYENILSIDENEELQECIEKIVEFTRKCYGRVISPTMILDSFEQFTDVYVSDCFMDVLKELIGGYTK